jgi:HD-GYP domain-containing protein (c-di-GMP phosphodiesterase class II)
MNKKIFLIIFLVILAFYIGAQDLEERYLGQANKEYLNNNYSDAYLYINFVFNLYEGQKLPLPARVLGEKIYYFLLESLIEDEDFESIDEIAVQVEKFPSIASLRVGQALTNIQKNRSDKEEADRLEQERILQLAEEKIRIAQINKALEDERAAQARLEAIRAAERRLYEQKEKEYQAELELIRELEKKKDEQQQAQLESIRQAELERNEQQKEALWEEMSLAKELEIERAKQAQAERAQYEQTMIELMESKDVMVSQQQREFNELLQSSIEKQDENASSSETISLYVIIIIAVIGLFLFTGFGLLIFLSVRNSQDNQRRFENTLNTMHSTRPITSINNQYALPDVTESIEHLQLEDSSGQKALPSPDDESEKLKEMLQTCKKYGEQINQVTNRKNNSRNTAELVYKISKEMGYDEKECLLHFSVGMIYDIGFMSIDPEILSRENVSDEEFDIIKNHVNLGVNMIYFIDKQYHPLFRDGILKHHENLDGSGYPSGLKDTEIPYIARVLHVVESFLSLVSSRNYKAIQDRESAIEQLLTENDKYDEKILEALNAIV